MSLAWKFGEVVECLAQFVFYVVGGGDTILGNGTPDLENVVFDFGRNFVTDH